MGLKNKYTITKNDGSKPDPKARYFVLRLDNSSAARGAARHFAEQIRNTDVEFFRDIMAELAEIEGESLKS